MMNGKIKINQLLIKLNISNSIKKIILPSSFNSTSLIIICLCLNIYFSYYFSYRYAFIFLTSGILSLITTKLSINLLTKINIKQFIRIEGPKEHYKKEGTPTAAGLILVPLSILISLVFTYNLKADIYLSLIIILTLYFWLIGSIDDIISCKNHKNKGLSIKTKFMLEVVGTILFLFNCINNNLLSINLFLIPLFCIIIVGISNASNLTDGLDGLASGNAILIFLGLSIYLALKDINEYSSLIIFCMVMAGIWSGFLFFNKNPARIFMGDAGSLVIGSSIAGIGVLTQSIPFILFISLVFIIETVSVIIQVVYFKWTKFIYKNGKKIFLMTPIHHHFELQGIDEKKIVYTSWWTTSVLTVIGITLKLIN